ncbi:glycosyltransferase family 4 protein [Acidithiobacillus sp. M4-SHS-6]|uniref:glycosyltransferase family 4 protein n=1 Tax=Acidithiobacillus sp. M4-SHS-6 TaxID=3383024 RepID=UPI0039BE1472
MAALPGVLAWMKTSFVKILFLHSLVDPDRGGGAEVIVWEQMRGLRDAGHDCVLLATSDQPGLERSEREGITVWQAGIRNVYWPYHKKRPTAPWRMLWHAVDSYNPWMQGYLRNVVARERPDVASVHNLPGWSAASWVSLTRLGVPAVQVLHDYYPICVKASMYKQGRNCTGQCAGCRVFRLPHRALSRKLAAVVGVSRFMLDRHRALGYFEGVPVQRVIHNARAPQALGVNDQPPSEAHQGLRFGFIGRLDPSKGIEPLIAAFLAADLPEAELWIAGGGKQEYEQHLQGLVREPRIRLLGRQRPADFYPQVDVVVVSSLWNDNLPGVVFEALAFGKPVIASRRGGIPEMIRHGENGLLFEPDAPGELQAALVSMQDETLRVRLTAQARPSSAPFMDMARWIGEYEALYCEVRAGPMRTRQQEEV